MEDNTTGTISTMNHTGDIKYKWDRANPEEVAAAKEHFAALRAKGFIVFRVGTIGCLGKEVTDFPEKAKALIFKSGTTKIAKEFEPEADYVATPPIAGG